MIPRQADISPTTQAQTVEQPRVTAAGKYSETTMAALFTLSLVTILAGVLVGAFLKLSFTIRREDRVQGSLRHGALDPRDQTVRSLVGAHSSGWD